MKRDGLTFPEALKVLAAKAGVELDERTTARGRPQEAPPRRPRERDRLLPRGPDRLEDRRAGARLPPRPRLHRRDDREIPARLRARRLGHADAAARGQAQRPRRRARRGRARPAAAVGTGRRLRPLPRAGDLPDPRRERLAGRARRADPRVGRGGWRGSRPEVPQLPGDAAVRQEPDALPHRQGEGPDPQVEPGGDRRGLHGRADGPPGGLRQRRRVARDRAHAGPGRAADALREEDRPRLRRRRGRREGRDVRGDRRSRR